MGFLAETAIVMNMQNTQKSHPAPGAGTPVDDDGKTQFDDGYPNDYSESSPAKIPQPANALFPIRVTPSGDGPQTGIQTEFEMSDRNRIYVSFDHNTENPERLGVISATNPLMSLTKRVQEYFGT